MAKWWRRATIGLGLLSTLGAVSGWTLYRASQAVPDFYEAALQTQPVDAQAAGDQLERQMFTLHNDLHHEQTWEAVFTDQQINGWLSSDLNEKFPSLVPAEVTEPRVLFEDGVARVAFRLKSPKLSTIVSFQLEPRLTERPNELAIALTNVRAGTLPLPLGEILDRIAKKANQSGLQLQWTQDQGHPVAMVQLPLDRDEIRQGVTIQQLSVRRGELFLSGIATADQIVEQQRPDKLASKSPKAANR